MATTTTDRLSYSERRGSLPPFVSTAAMIALFLSPHSQAAEWRFTPTLQVRETYTDNVRLAEEGAEESDFISDISPGFNISAKGPRLKLRANYVYQYLHYANESKESGGFHKLNASTNIDLIKDLFAFDGTASIHQQNLSLDGPRTIENYPITDNRTTVKTATASPYLRHRFSDIAVSELRYTHTAVDTDSDAVSSSRSDDVLFSVNSGPSFRRLGWGLTYTAQRSSLIDTDPVNSSTVTGNLQLMLNPQFSLTAAAGYDKYDYIAADGAPSPEGSFYSGGFSWRPTERTRLAASVGHRFYGRTYSLDSSIRSRASVWRLSYDENITTSLSEFGLTATENTSDLLNQLFRSSIPDDAQRQQAVDRFILATGLPPTLSRSINYLTNQFFLQKALRGSVAITGAKNTIVLTAFNVSRRAQSLDDSTLPTSGVTPLTNGDTRQTGLNALWNWKMSARSSATLSADISKSKADLNDTEQRVKVFRASFARRLQPKLDGVIELKHSEQTSNLSGNNYQENAVNAFLSMKF